MAGEPELTGLAKTFNSVTFTGRANVAKATYAGGKLGYLGPILVPNFGHKTPVSPPAIIGIVVAVKAKGYLTK